MNFAFKRMTRALLVPVVNSPTAATALTVPDGFIKPSYNAFQIFNPNTCVVGLRGTSRMTGDPVPTAPLIVYANNGVDWEFPPGFVGVYSTQYPYFMSAAAVSLPIAPDVPADADLKPLRIMYGIGM